jgi:hypothetical protein
VPEFGEVNAVPGLPCDYHCPAMFLAVVIGSLAAEEEQKVVDGSRHDEITVWAVVRDPDLELLAAVFDRDKMRSAGNKPVP